MNELFVKSDDAFRMIQDHFRCEDSALKIASPLQLPQVSLPTDDALSIRQALAETSVNQSPQRGRDYTHACLFCGFFFFFFFFFKAGEVKWACRTMHGWMAIIAKHRLRHRGSAELKDDN